MSHQHGDCNFVVSFQKKMLVVLISLTMYPDSVATEVSLKPHFVRSKIKCFIVYARIFEFI